MSSRLRMVPPDGLAPQITALLGGADTVVCPIDPAHPTLAATMDDAPAGFAGVIVPTSGSTGDPKMVMLSREALIAAAQAAEERLGGPGQWINPLPVWHVAGLMTVVRAVVAGQPNRAVSPHLEDMPQVSQRAYLSLVPAQLSSALADPRLTDRVSRCQAVLVGGGSLDDGLRRQAQAKGIRVVTTYGMTETCGGVVYDGQPLRDVRIQVVDDAGDPIGDGGAVGRVAITGPMIFNGYLGDEAATAAVLRGRRLLTLDRGVVTGGVLRVIGRVDDVIQSGGVNVDLAQVQRHLDAGFLGQVACFAVPDPVWGSTVVVASTGPDLATLRQWLSTRVESPAQPRALLTVDALPRTASGKIDRAALRRQWGHHGSR